MQVVQTEITKLKPYSGNAKVHPDWQIEQIARSIQEFGFNDPIAIDEKGTIIEGHGRYQAAKKLGLKKVPTIELSGMTDDQRKAYIIAHNKLTMNTGFDSDILIAELESMNIDDLTLTGFSQDELDELILDAMGGDDEETESGSNGNKSGAPKTASETVPFHVVMTPEERENVFEAIQKAKSAFDVDTAAEALNKIALYYLSST